MKNRAVAATVAAAATAGILLGSSFDNPADVIRPPDDSLLTPVVQFVADDPAPDDDGGGQNTGDQENDDQKKRKGGLRQIVRDAVLRMPVAVRACVCLPLWAVGSAIITLVSLLGSALGVPVLESALRILLTAAALFGILLGTVKVIAPGVPVKKMLKPRNLLFLLVAAVVAEAGLVAVRLFVDEGDRIAGLVHSGLTLTTLGAVLLPFTAKAVKVRKRERA